MVLDRALPGCIDVVTGADILLQVFDGQEEEEANENQQPSRLRLQ